MSKTSILLNEQSRLAPPLTLSLPLPLSLGNFLCSVIWGKSCSPTKSTSSSVKGGGTSFPERAAGKTASLEYVFEEIVPWGLVHTAMATALACDSWLSG